MGALDMPLGAIALGYSRFQNYEQRFGHQAAAQMRDTRRSAYKKQTKTCNYCGETGFTWTMHEGHWRLQSHGIIHACNEAIEAYRARYSGRKTTYNREASPYLNRYREQRAVETFIASLSPKDQRRLRDAVEKPDDGPLNLSGPEFQFDP
jgi:hypothetical protein